MRKIIGLTIMVIVFLVSVIAPGITAEASIGGFSVNPIFPENQIPGETGFFDLLVTPGDRQEIGISVNNRSDEEIQISITLVTATTNRNGIIDYTAPGISDVTLRHGFADIASWPLEGELISISPGYSGEIPIFIDIPSQGFDGIILGAVRVTSELTDEQIAEGGMIVNRFSHIIVVRMQEEGNYTELPADFQLGEVGAGLVNHRATIVADIRNPQARFSRPVTVSSQIFPAGSNTPLFERSDTTVYFAPNSVFEYSMIDDSDAGSVHALEAGTYLARIQLVYNGIPWEFEREFQIGATEAADLNEADVAQAAAQEYSGGGLPIEILIAIGAGAIFLIALIALIASKSKKSKKREYEQSQQRLLEQERRRQQLSSSKTAGRATPAAPPTVARQTPVEPPTKPPAAPTQNNAAEADQTQQMDPAEMMRLMQQMQQMMQNQQDQDPPKDS